MRACRPIRGCSRPPPDIDRGLPVKPAAAADPPVRPTLLHADFPQKRMTMTIGPEGSEGLHPPRRQTKREEAARWAQIRRSFP
jgi:hypothetical protein